MLQQCSYTTLQRHRELTRETRFTIRAIGILKDSDSCHQRPSGQIDVKLRSSHPFQGRY